MIQNFIKYFVYHALKQLIKRKPIIFAYKFWALCSFSSYCSNFNLYCGENLSDRHKNLQDHKFSTAVFETFSSKMWGVHNDDWWASKYATTIKAKNGIGQYLQEY